MLDSGESRNEVIRPIGRGDVENRIKEGKNTLRWDKTSCQRFEANQARLQMGVLAYNLLHMIRQFYVWGEEVQRSMEWLIKRLIKVGAGVSYHARRWYAHGAPAFSLAHHYRAVWPGVLRLPSQLTSGRRGLGMPEIWGKLTFRPNLCYFATCEKNWLRE